MFSAMTSRSAREGTRNRDLFARILMSLCAMMLFSGVAQSATLDEAMEVTASKVSDFLGSENQKQIILKKEVISKGTLPATSGPKIADKLEEKLKAAGIEIVKAGGQFAVRAEFSKKTNSTNNTSSVEIEVYVENDEGSQQFKHPQRVTDQEDVLSLTQTTVNTPVLKDEPTKEPAASDPEPKPGEDPNQKTGDKPAPNETEDEEEKKRAKAITVSLEAPSFNTAPTDLPADGSPGDAPPKSVVSTDEFSPYAIEIVVKNPQTGKYDLPRVPTDVNGYAFVDIQPSEVYAVRLINNSDYGAGVTLEIDGLSGFYFADDNDPYKRTNKWYVNPKSSALVIGWYIRSRPGNKLDLREFEVTKYGEGVAADLGITAGIGTITAKFCAAWERGQEPPPGQLRGREKGTKLGQEVIQPAERVVRFFGKTRDQISVRYEKPDVSE